MAITRRQKEVLDFIRLFVEARGYAPTIAEIQSHFKLKSSATIHEMLSILEREGMIRRSPNVSRGIEITSSDHAENKTEIPLLGVIAAGHPIEAILTMETISVPRDMIGRKHAFGLKVRGDSMIGEGILDNDFIIVESRDTAESGQTVVALIDGSDTTVKRFYKSGRSIRLEAANPKYKPTIIKPPHRISIQGVVIGVIRKYRH
jgi:repressor LexA